MSQLHPRHRHATVLETAATDHCLAAHRSQPTPNYLFWDAQPLFSSATLSILLLPTAFLSPSGVVVDIARGRHFERHHDPAAHPATLPYPV